MTDNHTSQRDYILIYLNGQRHELRGAEAFMTLSDYLRQQRQLTGTKVVCAEGDCGACTVLTAAIKPQIKIQAVAFKAINACIQFMHGLDCNHIITIEGLPKTMDSAYGLLNPVQQAMVKAQGTQCGFCTPGFVMAAAGMLEHKGAGCSIKPQQARHYLTGNLCRCTGYQSIINAVTAIDTQAYQSVKQAYHSNEKHQQLLAATQQPVSVEHQKNHFYSPTSTASAASHKASHECRIFAAATDLGVQFNKGHWHQQQVLSLNLIATMHQVEEHAEGVTIGARVSLAELEQKLLTRQPEWVEFMHIFASPQIKNNGTLVGNIANGSPIGDNLPFLLAMDAKLLIQSPTKKREVNINDFYLGYKKMDLADDEIITHVELPNRSKATVLKLYKVSQRRDLDISCVAAAIKMEFNAQQQVTSVAIALGGVAATPIRMPEIEQLIQGLRYSELVADDHCETIAQQLAQHTQPMSDVRGSAQYRQLLVANLYKKYIDELKQRQEHAA